MDFTLDRSRQIPRGSGATATTQEWVLHGPCLPIRTWCSTTAQGRLPVLVLGRNSHLSQRATPRIPLGATLALAAIDFRPRDCASTRTNWSQLQYLRSHSYRHRVASSQRGVSYWLLLSFTSLFHRRPNRWRIHASQRKWICVQHPPQPPTLLIHHRIRLLATCSPVPCSTRGKGNAP